MATAVPLPPRKMFCPLPKKSLASKNVDDYVPVETYNKLHIE